jgi:hypothetical protein
MRGNTRHCATGLQQGIAPQKTAIKKRSASSGHTPRRFVRGHRLRGGTRLTSVHSLARPKSCCRAHRACHPTAHPILKHITKCPAPRTTNQVSKATSRITPQQSRSPRARSPHLVPTLLASPDRASIVVADVTVRYGWLLRALPWPIHRLSPCTRARCASQAWHPEPHQLYLRDRRPPAKVTPRMLVSSSPKSAQESQPG